MAKRELKSTQHYSHADQYLLKMLEDFKPNLKPKTSAHGMKIKSNFLHDNKEDLKNLIDEQCSNHSQS